MEMGPDICTDPHALIWLPRIKELELTREPITAFDVTDTLPPVSKFDPTDNVLPNRPHRPTDKLSTTGIYDLPFVETPWLATH
jgi:hypothetical protein